MTADWLSELDPAPPEELAAAMRGALGGATSNQGANDLLDAAERLLDKVLRSDCEKRASALDLLTVDALMTHSLQIAKHDSEMREDFAERAMHRITSRAQD